MNGQTFSKTPRKVGKSHHHHHLCLSLLRCCWVFFSGTFLLTELLLDKLKASAPSRIINTAAAAANLGSIDFDNINLKGHYTPGKGFSQSKFAVVLYTLYLAEKLKGMWA